MKGRMTQKNYAKGQGSTSIYFLLWAAFSVFALIIVLLFALTQNLLLKQTYKDEITKSLAMNGTTIQKELNDYRGPNYSSFVRYQAALYDVGVYILGADGSVMFPIEEDLEPSDPFFGEHMDFSEKVKRLRKQLTESKGMPVIYEDSSGEFVYGAVYGGETSEPVYLYVSRWN